MKIKFQKFYEADGVPGGELPETIIVPVEEDEDDTNEAEINAAVARIEVLETANAQKDEKILALEAEVIRAHERCRVLEENQGGGDNVPNSVHFWGRKMFS